MKYESIADIYSANQKIREDLIAKLAEVSPEEATAIPDGEKWSIQQIVEHLSMVEFGVSRICAKLLDGAKADGKTSDGGFTLSEKFGARAREMKGLRVEAPDRVRPTGEVTINEALERMKASGEAFRAIQSDLESVDSSAHTFPHPFFGDLTAAEWLVMVGWHERRHTGQIDGLLTKIRE